MMGLAVNKSASFGSGSKNNSLFRVSQRNNQLILGLAVKQSAYFGSRREKHVDYDGLRGKGLWATQQTRHCHVL